MRARNGMMLSVGPETEHDNRSDCVQTVNKKRIASKPLIKKDCDQIKRQAHQQQSGLLQLKYTTRTSRSMRHARLCVELCNAGR
jgi:hypothetical protein